MYIETFKESWKKLYENPQLFIPDIVLFVVSSIVAVVLLVLFIGTNPEISTFLGEGYLVAGEDLAENLLSEFVETLEFSVILSGLVYLAVFIIVTFFVGSGTDVAKYYLIRELLIKKKIKFSRSLLKGARPFFWRYVLMRMVSFVLIFAVLFIPTFFIVFFGELGQILVAVLLGIFVFVATIFFILWFFFLDQILFLSRPKISELFFNAFELLKKKTSVVVLTFLITIAAGIAISVVFDLLNRLFTSIPALILILTVFNLVIALIFSVWPHLFKFMIYSKIEKIKR